MSNNLSTLLAELSEIAPQICQKDRYLYIIGEYAFFISNDKFQARQSGFFEINPIVTGLPAYDWLQGILMRVIKSKDWGYKIQSPASAELTFAKVYFLPDGIFSSDGDNPTEALLTALIMAIRGNNESN